MNEFRDENNFNLIDEFVMSFSPNKRQFEFLRDVILKKEYEVRFSYKNL